MAPKTKLIERIQALLRINADDLLMEASDPEDAIAHYRDEMEQGLAQARDAVAAALVQERDIERRLASAQAACEEWDAKTDAALQAGDEVRARSALGRKLSYQHIANDLQARLDHHRQVMAEMKAGLAALREKADGLAGRREKKP